MTPTELSEVRDSTKYDRAILAWRAAPSAANYAAREEAHKEYYAYLRGYYLDIQDPTLLVEASA